jgi:hypothetical protein
MAFDLNVLSTRVYLRSAGRAMIICESIWFYNFYRQPQVDVNKLKSMVGVCFNLVHDEFQIYSQSNETSYQSDQFESNQTSQAAVSYLTSSIIRCLQKSQNTADDVYFRFGIEIGF